jgi:LAS superfamily LD-carboxypeptidase LdcB
MPKKPLLPLFLIISISLLACEDETVLVRIEKRDTIIGCTGVELSHLSGQFDPSQDSSFAVIPQKYTTKERIFMRTEALDAFQVMWQAANDDGINLTILSAARNWTYQRGIWNRKWKSDRYHNFEGVDRAIEILKYSAMPGSSRHHWGTDIDLNAFENKWFEEDPLGIATYEWLREHAPAHGFLQVYGDQSNGRTGYREEKWHWSYMPIAAECLKCYLSTLNDNKFQGFDGAQWADSLRIIERYVGGIDGKTP